MTTEEEEEIVENYCKTRNMCLISVSGLRQIIEEATLRKKNKEIKNATRTDERNLRE